MEQFIGEIRMFGGNYAPVGWAFCDGQELSISQNDALFSLIGTTYGGDGVSTFGLPDLRGRIPLHQGVNQATGTHYLIGSRSGTETVTLTESELPSHTHRASAYSQAGNAASPANAFWAQGQVDQYASTAPNTTMNPDGINNVGGNQPHENVMPFLCISFIISLVGIYPSRN